jgi:hypothetical protein
MTEVQPRSVSGLFIFGLLTMLSAVLTPLIGALGPFQNGQAPTGEEALFLPAGYVFSIWAVIYLGLFLLGLWLLLQARRHNVRATAAAPWIFLTTALNVLWIVLAGQATTAPWTVPVLIGMEITAWIAYFRLQVGNPALPALERRLHLPMQLYVGWLSVATVANTSDALMRLGWNGWGLSAQTWTIIMLIIATALAYRVGRLSRGSLPGGQDNVYRGVFVWAFIGIAAEQARFPAIVWTALLLALVILVMIVGSRKLRAQSVGHGPTPTF